MISKQEKLIAIRTAFREWLCDIGSCMHSVRNISLKTGIAAEELWNSDHHTGLLAELCNDGLLVRCGRDHFELDSSAIRVG